MSGGLLGQGDVSSRRLTGDGPGVLCIHGFGGTPLEVDLAVDVALELGLAARAPLLPGHGVHAKKLAQTGFNDWLDGVTEEREALLHATGDVIIVGLSLGSLLAVEATLSAPERVRGLVLLANAFWLRAPFPAWALFGTDRFHLPDVHLPKLAADIQDPEARRTHLTLGAQPSRAAAEVWRAGTRLRGVLGRLRCPVLILHGERDRVCPVANARRVAARIGSDDVRVRIFPRSGHIVTRDYDRDDVRRELLEFMRRV